MIEIASLTVIGIAFLLAQVWLIMRYPASFDVEVTQTAQEHEHNTFSDVSRLPQVRALVASTQALEVRVASLDAQLEYIHYYINDTVMVRLIALENELQEADKY